MDLEYRYEILQHPLTVRDVKDVILLQRQGYIGRGFIYIISEYTELVRHRSAILVTERLGEAGERTVLRPPGFYLIDGWYRPTG